MTREEIEELKGLAASMGLYDDKKPCKRAVILGKAIKALEQELCEDAISRQAAIKAFKPRGIAEDVWQECNEYKVLSSLPPVNPQVKTGHFSHDGSYWKNRFICSECGYKLFDEPTNYCPDCGAKMFEPQERSEKDADKKCTYKETGCGSCKRQLDCPIEADKAESEDKE